jgi:hypothetical protein
MARHSSATPRERGDGGREEDAETGGRGDTETGCSSSLESHTVDAPPKSHIIDASLKRRARLLITNSSIPRQTRSLIRHALERQDPYLAQVVSRLEEGNYNRVPVR